MSGRVVAIREKRRPAKRPTPRTITVGMAEGDFAGWQCEAKIDFPASLLADLQSQDAIRFLHVMDAIVVDHNFPNADDEIAATMADVDPYSGLVAMARQIFDAIGALPPR